MAERPAYLQPFLTHDYDASCSADSYCMFCSMAVCSHCCPAHAREHHHLYERRDIFYAHVRVMDRGFGPSVDALAVRGCGFNWNPIQQVNYGSYQRYIPLERRAPGELPPAGAPRQCHRCLDRMTLRGTYCCCRCQLIDVEDGNELGRERALGLVNTNYLHQYPHDRYCTRCRDFYISRFCGLHAGYHHPNRGEIIRVVRSGGWVLTRVEGSVIPQDILDGVQRIDVGGVAMVPIIPRAEPAEGEPGGICTSCFQVIADDGIYCSIRCKSVEENWFVP